MKVLEIAIFKLQAGISDAAVLQASEALMPALRRMEGYIKRELVKGDDGEWVDIVHWQSLDAAQRAADTIMSEPSAEAFMQMIDPSTIQMRHCHQVAVFDA
jgi:hypothetical protein